MSKKFGKKNPGGHNSNSFRMSEKPLDGPPVELENQFVLRLPTEPSLALREAIKSGASNLKERLFIQLEPDKSSNTQYLRRGHVQFDGWNFTSRLVDMPTIIESHKTIDNKTFYKTADICQLLICKEGEDFDDEEDTNSPVKKKKDPNKVDKKYLYPHGIGPPLKNCRKRRFRKTLRKKYVEAPEIEKEVKRLLRVDNEAVSVKWEVITEEELNANKGGEAGKDNPDVKPSVSGGFTNDPKDLGLDLSDSDNDEERDVDIDSEENSRLSAGDDSRMSDSVSNATTTQKSSPVSVAGPTQFSKEMFAPPGPSTSSPAPAPSTPGRPSRQDQLAELRMQMMHMQSKKKELEHNIANCPNEALKNRFRAELLTVATEIKRLEAGGFN
eukprot:GFUD01040582.1.p1 GENE.GFUD01040582.1~~GFUD01040582.1.p1  ORF type:complete len:384 (+),score=135.15 GFUD01040582.1:53-1204(+)